MHHKKIENILALSDEARYSYFVTTIAETEEVWGLYQNGWATLSDKEKRIIIPFWPEKEFALMACADQWQDYTPKSIVLNDFKNKWLPGMSRDNSLANLFHVSTKPTNVVVEPEALLSDLDNELQKFL